MRLLIDETPFRRKAGQLVNGQFVEPDTTELDQRLLAELAPLAERLGAWVETACAGAAQ